MITEATTHVTNQAANRAGTGATWTASRVQQLQSCVTAGLTCSQIAAEIGVSRNAVIGKLHRLGLSAGGRKPAALAGRMREGPLQVRRQTRLVRALRAMHAKMAAAMPAGTMPEPATGPETEPAVESAQQCTLLELASGHCRWPLGDPSKAGFAFCGNDSLPGFSYCLGHARLAYRLPASRRA